MKNPKTINSLMAYMRRSKGIKIEGSTQKRKLRYMGYFHGYKGYRFYGRPTNLFSYTTFNELQAVYSFDMDLKTLTETDQKRTPYTNGKNRKTEEKARDFTVL